MRPGRRGTTPEEPARFNIASLREQSVLLEHAREERSSRVRAELLLRLVQEVQQRRLGGHIVGIVGIVGDAAVAKEEEGKIDIDVMRLGG